MTTKLKRWLVTALLIVTFSLPFSSEGYPEVTNISVTQDPATGNIIERFEEDGKLYETVFEPTTKFEADLFVMVRFDRGRKVFEYAYEVHNKPQSQQMIFFFGTVSSVLVREVKMPEGWGDLAHSRSPRIPPGPGARWMAGLKRILPGESLGGFSFSSEHLPAIAEAELSGKNEKGSRLLRSNVPFEPPREVADLTTKLLEQRENVFVLKKTVGPLPVDDQSPLGLVDRLLSLKEQSLQLGWIDNQGVATSLNKKLAHAKRRLGEGMVIPAINVLHAFIHELQAQKGKHVNDNTFYLLKPNAEFLIFKLEKG